MAQVVPDPSLQQLRALRDVALAGGYSAALAAESPHSRANVWQLVRRLEEYVTGPDALHGRIRLVGPGGRELTQEGAALLNAADKLLDVVDDVRGVVHDLRLSGARVAVSCYPAHAHLVAQASRWLAAQPDPIEVQFREVADELRRESGAELLRTLRRGDTDIVISSDPAVAADRGLSSDFLYRWALVLVVHPAHRLHGREIVDVTELLDERLLASPPDHASRQRLREVGAERSVAFDCESADALFDLALQEWGVAVMANDSFPVRAAPADLRRGWPTLAYGGSPIGGEYHVVYRSSPAAQPGVERTVRALRRSVEDRSIA